MRTPLAVSIAVAGLLAVPSVAAATDPSTVSRDASGTTTFRSGSEPADLVVEELFDLTTTFADFGNPLVAGAGCVGGTPTLCPSGPVEVRLRSRSDRARVFTFASRVNISAGRGHDRVQASQIRGTTHGGPGEDRIRANSRDAQVFGDGGADEIYVREAFMQAFGDDGNDLLVSDADPGTLDGGDGFDILIAGNQGAAMDGGDDPDVIGFFPDVVNTLPVNGGDFYDWIHGSEGPDPITAGSGNDEIWVHGGGSDTVDCDGGFDVVYADETDMLTADCERIRFQPGPVDPRFEAALVRAEELRGFMP